jgi:hypothetical protein
MLGEIERSGAATALATMAAADFGFDSPRADEFGTTGHHARRLGRMALSGDDPWDLVVGAQP